MGLDITAYSNVSHVGKHTDELWCEEDGHVFAFAYSAFPRSFGGLPFVEAEWSKGGQLEFLISGCFEVTAGTEIHCFRAGSYSGYNRWRSNLADQFNPQELETDERGMSFGVEPDQDKPFYELIWFADNEGCIGPDAARELLADFREHEPTYKPWYEQADPYKEWMRACELAAESGLIRFH